MKTFTEFMSQTTFESKVLGTLKGTIAEIKNKLRDGVETASRHEAAFWNTRNTEFSGRNVDGIRDAKKAMQRELEELTEPSEIEILEAWGKLA